MIRKWTKSDAKPMTTRPCIRYDFGEYEGWLDGDQWVCWRILSTVQEGDSIIQTLDKMPTDYCPFVAYSIETLEIGGSLDRPQITGWSLNHV